MQDVGSAYNMTPENVEYKVEYDADGRASPEVNVDIAATAPAQRRADFFYDALAEAEAEAEVLAGLEEAESEVLVAIAEGRADYLEEPKLAQTEEEEGGSREAERRSFLEEAAKDIAEGREIPLRFTETLSYSQLFIFKSSRPERL